MVGDHHKVNRRLGIWFRPDLWALVSFFHFMDSSKPLAFSLYKKKEIYKLSIILREFYHKLGQLDSFHRANSNPYQNSPSQVGKYVPLKRVCSKIPSTPPSAWIMSVR